MGLRALVEDAFSVGGQVSCAIAGFTPRSGQTAMALAVADTLEHGGSLVVEAGTGVGKTFAYLVPALLSGERVLLSTATKALQDQLSSRDIPQLLGALGIPVKLAVLKGRSSYVCLHRLGLARQDSRWSAADDLRLLALVELWANVTPTGDLAEVQDLDEHSALMPAVSSTRDNCLGAGCPRWSACHVQLARRQAVAADLVVVNHHLLFADMAMRESGVAELLPRARVVIVDEAHQLNEAGIQFLGAAIGTDSLAVFCDDLLDAGLQWARGLKDWSAISAAVSAASRGVRRALDVAPDTGRWRWPGQAPEGVQEDEWGDALGTLCSALEASARALGAVDDIAPDLRRLHERSCDLVALLRQLAQDCPEDALRWIDAGGPGPTSAWRAVESPLNIANRFTQQRMASAAATEGERSWVFTSATLGHDAQLRWFTELCGLGDATVLRVDSPFDYAAQAALYIPADLPEPADPAHSAGLAALVAGAASQLGGRTLVLTTTLKAMRFIGDALTAYFERQGGIDVLVQGQGSKRDLMARFRNNANNNARPCVLVGSVSFWEGFDVPGNALQLLVIDKLPFPPPNDPQVEARSRQLEAQGRNAFNDGLLPEAILSLKQGVGRLIRHESDKGILVIGDTRLLSKGYGRQVLAALPPMRRLTSADGLSLALDDLVTTASTRDLPRI